MLRNVTLIAISFSLAVAMGELIVRSFYDPVPVVMDGFSLSRSSYYQADSELGWVPRPNVQGEHSRGRFTSHFSTNSLGLRDGEHARGRVAGLSRLVVLGDSFAWGYGVSDGEIFADVLERRLPKLEVVNFGVTGYGLSQEIAYFKRLGNSFNPDTLLVALVQNDIYDPPVDLSVDAGAAGARPSNRDPTVARESGNPLRRFKSFLTNNVAMYRLTVDVINSNRALVDFAIKVGLKENLAGFERLDPNIGTALRNYPPLVATGWQNVFSQLRDLKSFAGDHGARLIIVLVPALQSVKPDALNRSIAYTIFRPTDFEVGKPYAMLEMFGVESGIEIINPLQSFVKASQSGQELYLRGDMHFNANGHALFADEIARYLSREN